MERLTIVAFTFFAIDEGKDGENSLADRSERPLLALWGSTSEPSVFYYCGIEHHQIIRARNLPGAELFQVRGYPLSIEQ